MSATFQLSHTLTTCVAGVLHLIQRVPLGIWLGLLLWLGFKAVQRARSSLEVGSWSLSINTQQLLNK